MISMSNKDEYVKFKNHERKINWKFITYVDFEHVLIPEDNGKKNPDQLYTNKYQKYVACSYSYKLVLMCWWEI